MDQFSLAELSKIRYKIFFDHNLWEIDELLEDNQGLIIAEIELKSEEENFALPDFIECEVTGEEKYQC